MNMRKVVVRKQTPSASRFVRRYLKWILISDPRVDEMSKKLKEAIDKQMDTEHLSRYSYRFLKYARFSKKKIDTVYGLALVGWRHYRKYKLYPNLWSYLEVDNLADLDKAIDAIGENFDKVLNININFLKTGFGVFAIPRILYQEVLQANKNNQ